MNLELKIGQKEMDANGYNQRNTNKNTDNKVLNCCQTEKQIFVNH